METEAAANPEGWLKSIQAFVEMFDSCCRGWESTFPHRDPVFVLRILNCISANDGISQQQICQATGISKSEVCKIVGELTEKTWIEPQAANQKDGSRALHLRQTGHQALVALDQDFDKKLNSLASSRGNRPAARRRKSGRPAPKELKNTRRLF